jgi:predicted aspartyl protease
MNKSIGSLVLVFSLLLYSAPSRAETKQVIIPKTTSKFSIPYISVGVNDKKSVKFIFDTGSTSSAIKQSVVDELKLKPIGTETFSQANGKPYTAFLYKVDFYINGIVYKDVVVTGGDVVSNLLGQDVINRQPVLIHKDYLIFYIEK